MSRLKRVLIYSFCGLVLFWTGRSVWQIITTTAPDFSVYYYSTLDLFSGINPYKDKTLFTAFNYPVFTNLLYFPLVQLPYNLAQTIFIILSLAALIGSIYYSLHLLKVKITFFDFMLILSLSLFAFPVKFTLGMGQINLIALFFLIVSLWFQQHRRFFQSGLMLALAIISKPILGVFLFFFALRNFQIPIYALLIIGLSFLGTVLLGHQSLYLFYGQQVIPGLFNQAGKEVYYNQALTGFLGRLNFNPDLHTWLFYSCSFVITFWLFIKTKTKNTTQQFAIWLCWLLIINPLSWQHHFAFLLYPFLYLFFTLHKQKQQNKIGWLILAYGLVAINIPAPQNFRIFPFNLILSHSLYGTLILFYLLLSV